MGKEEAEEANNSEVILEEQCGHHYRHQYDRRRVLTDADS